MTSVSSEQRHRGNRPCAICGGRDGDPRGKGRRCNGFTSRDGEWVFCSREEHAGNLGPDDNCLYLHKMHGPCKCGITHAPGVNGSRSDVVAEYNYIDEHGKRLFQVVRLVGKQFRQRSPDGAGGWIWKMAGVRRVPYRLPELIAAHAEAFVFIVEGEKDADALAAVGAVATCNPGGSGKWHTVAETARKVLTNRDVVVIADTDDVGRAHAQQVAASLQRAVKSIRVIELAKKDAADFLASGGTIADIVKQARVAPLWTPPNGKANGHSNGSNGWEAGPPDGLFEDDEPAADPSPAPTTPRLPFLWVRDFGEFRKPAPLRWLLRDTRTSKPFLRAGKCTVLSGDGGVGKGFFWLQLAVCIALGHDLFDTFRPEQSGRVALLCGEDDQDEVHHRLVRIANALGLGNDDVARIQERVGVFPLAGEQVALQALDDARNPFRTATFEALVTQLTELANDGNFEWSLIGLDPLARFGAANVETDQSAATAFVQSLESMSARLPGAPASGVTHHSSAASAKTGRSNVRGVTGLRNAFRLAMILDAYETETGLRGVLLRNDKNNLAPVARPLWLVRMENEPMGDGRWIETAGVLRRASDDEAKELDAAAGTASCASREQREAHKTDREKTRVAADAELVYAAIVAQPGIIVRDLHAALRAAHGTFARDRADTAVQALGDRVRKEHGKKGAIHLYPVAT